MPGESRAENRARIEREIVHAARRQLAEVGAAGLSLREVAREIGMVSSAVYRYVESRDELLTRLITEAYDELGEAAEQAATAHAADDLERWTATTAAVRRWAFAHPHDYLLLFGSPVPGYAAPETTVASGTRATRALVGIVADAHTAGRLERPATDGAALPTGLAAELTELGAAQAAGIDADTVAAFVAAWTQLYGLISFEMTNQTRGLVSETDALFDVTSRRLAHRIGLR